MTNLCKTAFAILVSLAISGTAFSGEPLSKDTGVAPAAQPSASFSQAPSISCYSCTLPDGTPVKCHSSGTYINKYPCKSPDTHPLPHAGTCTGCQ